MKDRKMVIIVLAEVAAFIIMALVILTGTGKITDWGNSSADSQNTNKVWDAEKGEWVDIDADELEALRREEEERGENTDGEMGIISAGQAEEAASQEQGSTSDSQGSSGSAGSSTPVVKPDESTSEDTSDENTSNENTSGGNTSGGNTSDGNTSGGGTAGGDTSGNQPSVTPGQDSTSQPSNGLELPFVPFD